jgi:hypothetical protein
MVFVTAAGGTTAIILLDQYYSASTRDGATGIKDRANKVCHPWNLPLMGSRSLNSSVHYKWCEHDGKPDLHQGGGRSMQSKDIDENNKTKPTCFILFGCANSITSKLVACIQPPPASGQFRRAHCHHAPHKNKHNIQSQWYVIRWKVVVCSCKTKKRGMQAPPRYNLDFVFMQQRRRKKGFIFIL